MTKRKLNVKQIIIIAGIFLLVVVLLAAVLKMEGNIKPTEEEIILPEETALESGEMLGIDTPYCTLNYPAVWSEYLDCEGKKNRDTSTQTFTCTAGGEDVDLFCVYFNDTERGSYIGDLMQGSQAISVSVEGLDFEDEESWSNEKRIIVYSMMEAINVVIDSIMENEAYCGP